MDWRLFFENERTVKQKTDFSLGPSFIPNIVAENEQYVGSGLRVNHTAGRDPRGFQLLTDIRLEGAMALSKNDSLWNRYARGAADFTLSHGLPSHLIGGVTLSGGTTVGTVPTQRLWYLGGAQTVRGQRPDNQTEDRRRPRHHERIPTWRNEIALGEQRQTGNKDNM